MARRHAAAQGTPEAPGARRPPDADPRERAHLEAFGSRDLFGAFLAHGLSAVGSKGSILADSARELLFRASRGLPRQASKIVRRALRIAHEREQSFVDDAVMEAAVAEVAEL